MTALGLAPARPTRLDARGLLGALLDAGSFASWDAPARVPEGASPEYLADLERARERSGTDESVLTGEGRIGGNPVAVIASEFGFLGGSIGQGAADRIVAAIERAAARGLLLIAAPASGGTRMQEGTPAFLQMVRITRALADYKGRRLPYLVFLRHPTTGGVFASWGSLGHVTVAEPGALIGFLGPKVYAGLTGRDFPAGVQTAEHLFRHGTVDAVLDVGGFRRLAGDVLSIWGAAPHRAGSHRTADDGAAPPAAVDRPAAVVGSPSGGAWDSVLRTRDPRRPGLAELLEAGFGRSVRLHGTGRGGASASTVIVLAELCGRPVVVVGQDRAAQRAGSVLDAAGLAQARRGIRLAQELGLPLVTVIDTPGAELSDRAEEQAIAGGIADCVAALIALRVPSVAVLLGEGTGGGALALAAARRIVAAEHAWLAPLPPEGASVIVHGDVTRAAELSASQRIGARELERAGAVHELVAEGPGFLERVALAASRQLWAQGECG